MQTTSEAKLVSDAVDAAVRALAIPNRPKSSKARGRRRTQKTPASERFPRYALLFDTETTTDALQQLNFGVWRYCRVNVIEGEVLLDCVAEGIFYADDLFDRDPDGHAVLAAYARTRRAWVDHQALDAPRGLSIEPASVWLRRVMWRAAYELRAAVVCFNSPFDLSRLAWQAGETRTYKPTERTDAFEGGFSFAMFSYQRDGQRHESRYRPRVAIKSIDSKRSLKGFRSPECIDDQDLIPDGDGKPDRDEWQFRGHFLDLRTLVFALTDSSHSLQSACAAFGVPYVKREVVHGRIDDDYVTYCREDIAATERLCEQALTGFLRHPISLQATRAYSPATIGKGYLSAMGITPPAKRHNIDPRILGWAMSAYYGGRAECRLRRTPVPVVYCDFKSMYPTVCALMNIGGLLTAETIDTTDATTDVQQLLNDINADDCFEAKLWPQLVGIAQLRPDDDVLPVRARYGAGPNWQIGVNPLTSEAPMWFTIADLVASKLLTGKAPQILRAIRFVGHGRLPDLRPIELLRTTRADPRNRDFFCTVIEQRTLAKVQGRKGDSKGLKTLANATSYGIYAQMTRRELGGGRQERVTVYGHREHPHKHLVSNPEEPGEYAFPPIAAAITGAARLLLALVEHQVTKAGGTYAFCDTDSMAIVASERGGQIACDGGPHRLPDGCAAINALTYAQVDEIRDRFTALNPYDCAIMPGSILELEDENYTDNGERRQLHCYAISAKRYTFYVDESQGPVLVKPSQHGLGHLLNPTDPVSDTRDWIEDTWLWILRDALGLPNRDPAWIDQPAVAQHTISSPHLHRLLRTINHGRDYPNQIKPFNFLLLAFVHPLERPADDQSMVLIAPYAKDPADWARSPWINRYTGRAYAVTAEPSDGYERDRVVTVKTYRSLLAEYATHPETKSADATGARCRRATRGLLARRTVTAATITHIGKEANSLDEAQAGLHTRQDDILNTYDDTEQIRFEQALPRLRELGPREVARRTGHSVGAVHAVLAGRSQPRPDARTRYISAACERAMGT